MGQLIELAGATGPVNDGERRVVQALVQQLPDDSFVVPNVEVTPLKPWDHVYECDALVVTPHAVFVIEIKDFQARVWAGEREWTIGRRVTPSPVLQTERKARVVKSRICDQRRELRSVAVESAVVLARDPARLEMSDHARRRTFLVPQLIEFLTDPEAVRRRAGEISEHRKAIFEQLNVYMRPRLGQSFGPWIVDETLSVSAAQAEYLAHHEVLSGSPQRHLRVVNPYGYSVDPEQADRSRREALREAELMHAEPHRNLLAVREVFPDEAGRIVVVSDVPSGRPLHEVTSAGTPLTQLGRLLAVRQLCDAVEHLHLHGLIHRRIAPEHVLIDGDRTVLTGLGMAKSARSESTTVWRGPDDAGIDASYLAPELSRSNLGEPTAHTDLWSVAAVAYRLWSEGPAFPQGNVVQQSVPQLPTTMPRHLAACLGDLLQWDPADRTRSLDDLRAAIDADIPAASPQSLLVPHRRQQGDRVGDFEIRGYLAKGGFSDVYRAHWPMLDQDVALKIFTTPDSQRSVERELRVLWGLSHPNIVRTVNAGNAGPGEWYLATELAEGPSLAAVIADPAPVSEAQAQRWAEQLLSALASAHGRNVVHRDVKPSNLIATADGLVLIDFNIASPDLDESLTMSGTARYQPPDLDPRKITPLFDLFAAAVVLYEVLCKSHPYPGSSPRPGSTVIDAGSSRPDLAPRLRDLLARWCSPLSTERPATALQMLDELSALSRANPDLSTHVPTQPPPPQVEPIPEVVKPASTPRPAGKPSLEAGGDLARGSVSVHDWARELSLSDREVMDQCASLKINAPIARTMLSPGDADRVRRAIEEVRARQGPVGDGPVVGTTEPHQRGVTEAGADAEQQRASDPTPPTPRRSAASSRWRSLRVHELAEELGMTNKETLDLCVSLGIGVKTHNSQIEDAQADRVRRKAERESLTRGVQSEPPKPAAPSPPGAGTGRMDAPSRIVSSSGRKPQVSETVDADQQRTPRQDRPAPRRATEPSKSRKRRVHELAKELGMTNEETLDLCVSLGIGVNKSSSQIEDAQADRVRRKAERESLTRGVQPEPPKPAPPSPPGAGTGTTVAPSRIVSPSGRKPQVREIATRAGLSVDEVLEICRSLGIAGKDGSSSLHPNSADRVLQKAHRGQVEKLLKDLRPGEIRLGRIGRITNFGAFVDIGGIEGFVPASEMSSNPDGEPSAALNPGDEIKVKVTDVDLPRRRLLLSAKACIAAPSE